MIGHLNSREKFWWVVALVFMIAIAFVLTKTKREQLNDARQVYKRELEKLPYAERQLEAEKFTLEILEKYAATQPAVTQPTTKP